ncbi:MAG: hypothetical protein LBG97_04955 [Coriobacteriales bacterium]|jgi:hypothetical protein|nr:hypothetical protein [Coriobacteriales bacterium]
MGVVLLRFILMISIVLSAVFCAGAYSSQDKERLLYIGKTDFSRDIILGELPQSTDDTLNFLQGLSNEYQVSIVKKILQRGNIPENIYAGIFCESTFPMEQLGITGGSFIKAEDEFLASYDSGNPKQVGTLFVFGNDHRFTVKSLAAQWAEEGSIAGEYRIVSNRSYDYGAFLNKIATYFGVERDDLLPVGGGGYYSGAFIEFAIIAIGLLALLFALAASTVPLFQSKQIGAKKLLGWQDGHIWMSYIRWMPTLALITIAITDAVLLWSLASFSQAFVINLGIIHVIILLVFFGLSLIMPMLARQVNVSQLLKQAVASRLSVAVACILKLCFIAVFCMSAASMLPLITVAVDRYQAVAPWLPYSDYYVINSYKLNNESPFSPKLRAAMGGMYETLNNDFNVLYIEGNDYFKENNPFFTGTQNFQSLDVNPNYLKQFPLQGADGKVITVSEDDTRLIVLIPQSLVNSSEDIINFEQKRWQASIADNSAFKNSGTDNDSLGSSDSNNMDTGDTGLNSENFVNNGGTVFEYYPDLDSITDEEKIALEAFAASMQAGDEQLPPEMLETIEEIKIVDTQETMQSSQSASGAEASEITKDNEVLAITYLDDKPLFAFATAPMADNSLYLKNPVIIVHTLAGMAIENNYAFMLIDGANSSMKFPISEDRARELEAAFDASALAEHEVRLSSIKEVMNEEIGSLYSALTFLLLVLLVLFAIGVIAGTVLLQIIFISKRKCLAVMALQGWSFGARYKREILLFVAVNLIAIIVTSVLVKDLLVIPILALFALADFMILFIVVHRLEAKGVIAVLKGD